MGCKETTHGVVVGEAARVITGKVIAYTQERALVGAVRALLFQVGAIESV